MKFEQLDNYLFQETKSEKNYLKNPNQSVFPKEWKQESNQENNFYFLAFKNIIQKENIPFLIKKHSRYIAVPEHVHDSIELNYVYQGHFSQTIDRKPLTLHEGDVIIVDTEAPHAIAPVGRDDIIISMVIPQEYFKKNFFEQGRQASPLTRFILQALSENNRHTQYLLFQHSDNGKLKLFFQLLLSEYFLNPVPSYDFCHHYLQLIFLELIVHHQAQNVGTAETNSQFELAVQILSYIDQNYRDCQLNACAEEFGYAPSYFSKLVKECTGRTFQQLIQEKRLEVCSSQLLQTNLPVQDIAYNCGFGNMNHFYRVFQDTYHMTPKVFRKQTKS